MFGRKKPTTVAGAIASLVQAVEDLDRVQQEQAQLSTDKGIEAGVLLQESDDAFNEAGRAASVATKLREITEPVSALETTPTEA